MLDSVRHGCLTDETIDTLKSHIFKVSIQEKYKELEKTEKIELACVDVVDESGITAKFHKKQEKKLEKLKINQAKQLVLKLYCL
uniref:Uncharacterized protein n=1 Tax=Amphimedon queenslandica TaxID=400682 RepID=A0A1X7T801_AMPQE